MGAGLPGEEHVSHLPVAKVLRIQPHYLVASLATGS